MNSEKIVQMIKPYVKGHQLTYDDFEKIFDMLTRREKYLVADFVETRLKILLVDEIENADEKNFVEYVLNEIQSYVENNQLTYDEFDEIFGNLEKLRQYEVTNILDELDIELVDEKILPEEKNFVAATLPPMPRKAEEIKLSNNALISLVQKGDGQAMRDLCVKNRGLVDKFALKYDKNFNHKLDFEDLRQAGMIGMIEATRRFDFGKETQFSTYATWWIKQSISRSIIDAGFTVRLPVHIFEKITKLRRLYIEFSMLGKTHVECVELIAEEMELSEESTRYLFYLQDIFINLKSLDQPINEDEETTLTELLPAKAQDSVEEIVLQNELREKLDEVLNGLTEREKKVLKLRYGFYDGKEITLEQVGKVFGLTRERIRQIEKKALKKLRHPSRSKELKDFIELRNSQKLKKSIQ